MGATRTLALLRDGARKYADFIASGSAEPVFSNTVINGFVNDAISEYYEMLVAARGHEYFLAVSPIAVTGGTSAYTLPADFMELSSLTLEWDANSHELVSPIDSLLHRHIFNNYQTWSRGSRKGFRIYGTQDGTQMLEFVPAPGSSVTARLRYVPTFAPLAGDGASVFIVNGFDKLVELTAAIEMRSVKGLPIGALVPLRDAQVERLQEMAAERLADQPARVVDVYPERDVEAWPWPAPRV